VSGWLSNTGSWIEHHPGAAAWVQALGATLAVAAAVLVPALQSRNARRQRDADRRLRAKSLAIAIYPELLHIRAAHRHIQRRLQEHVTGGRHGGGPTAEATGAELGEFARRLTIPISDALRAMVPDFYLLGDPIGPQVQKCIGRCMKYNDVLNTLAGTTVRFKLSQLQSFIDNGLAQADACIAGIEQTWGLSADRRDSLDIHFTAAPDPAAASQRETANKETV
jgi:hypothetical protein